MWTIGFGLRYLLVTPLALYVLEGQLSLAIRYDCWDDNYCFFVEDGRILSFLLSDDLCVQLEFAP